jgi:hypothetical protein
MRWALPGSERGEELLERAGFGAFAVQLLSAGFFSSDQYS